MYNGRMIEKTVLDMTVKPHEVSHSVRLFILQNELLIVAWVENIDDNVVNCLFPMELILYVDDDDSIMEYEFTPHLENLVEFDINDPKLFEFPRNMMTITVPSHHVVRNYLGQLMMMKQVSSEINNEKETETMH